MPVTNHANGTSQAAIFVRLWETKDGKLPRTLARHILRLGFSIPDKARIQELASKNQQGLISSSELEELDNYIKAGDLLALLQSKARRALKKRKGTSAHHG
jgi:hypothetical protein